LFVAGTVVADILESENLKKPLFAGLKSRVNFNLFFKGLSASLKNYMLLPA